MNTLHTCDKMIADPLGQFYRWWGSSRIAA